MRKEEEATPTFPDTLPVVETENLLGGSFEMLSVALDMAMSEEPQPKKIPFDVLALFANVSRYGKSLAERIVAHPVTSTLLPYVSEADMDKSIHGSNNSSIQASLCLASWMRDLQIMDSMYPTLNHSDDADKKIGHGSGINSFANDDDDDLISEASWVAVRTKKPHSQAQSFPKSKNNNYNDDGCYINSEDDATMAILVQQRLNAAINSPLLTGESIEKLLKRRKADAVLDDVTIADTCLGPFEILSTKTTPPPPQPKRESRVERKEWQQFLNGNIASSSIRRRLFAGGCDDEVRDEIWKFIFGLFPWNSTQYERDLIMEEKRKEYYELKCDWISKLSTSHCEKESCPSMRTTIEPEVQTVKDSFSLIEKDVLRTDRDHKFFTRDTTDSHCFNGLPSPTEHSCFSPLVQLRNVLMTYACASNGLGYVQGMSDLCSPILVVLNGDEAETFWCFYGMMEKMRHNFRRDGAGMRKQLESMEALVSLMDSRLHAHLVSCDSSNMFFVFRLLLVSFKREFSFEDTLTLWESIWTNPYTEDFHLFVALAILEICSRDLLYLRGFDEILKYVNLLSRKIDVIKVLEEAEFLCLRFCESKVPPVYSSPSVNGTHYGNFFTLDDVLNK